MIPLPTTAVVILFTLVALAKAGSERIGTAAASDFGALGASIGCY
ncbi:hypothetical protein HDG34_000284 [Paraburkholderia sp. HC6.4b]|nr:MULTISPECIES: hypothetical protein [Paraburkholderia]MBB5406369.1 hypothetical protein [Paraburkholderia sp. HC6.4b]MBB5448767.1 hypothetical protein [Paraburkholderia sp. Kb1A]